MMKKRYLVLIFVVILIVGSLLTFLVIKNHNKFVKTDYRHADYTGYDKLMIVAHPDDETIWGGKALIEDDYVVVCITCGVVKERVQEFETVMQATNDKIIMLGYPDKTNGQKDNWDTVKEDIQKDLEAILNLKDWEIYVTHNPEGEYGHIHHQMTSSIVTSLAPHDKLVYFGKYYNKEAMNNLTEELPNKIEGEIYQQKIELLKKYPSQDFIFEMFDQMFPYENWLTYSEWTALYD